MLSEVLWGRDKEVYYHNFCIFLSHNQFLEHKCFFLDHFTRKLVLCDFLKKIWAHSCWKVWKSEAEKFLLMTTCTWSQKRKGKGIWESAKPIRGKEDRYLCNLPSWLPILDWTYETTKAFAIGDSEETVRNTCVTWSCIAIILLKIKKFIQVSSSVRRVLKSWS